jgi:hypothetical protein
MPRTLNVPAKALGFASMDHSARDIDWEAFFASEGEPWNVVLPPVTLGVINEYAPDRLTPGQAARAKVNPDARSSAEAFNEAFLNSDEGADWAERFHPMMSFVWPVYLGEHEPAEVAARMETFAPTCTLIQFGPDSEHCPEEYGIALNGGGMNLSDQIAAAYLCAHQIPPLAVLDQLRGVIGDYKRDQIGRPLKAAFKKAAEGLRARAKRLGDDAALIFKA